MTDRTYTLLADGSSDEVLCPIIDWLLVQHSADNWRAQFAFESLPAISDGLQRRAIAAANLFPCDVLFAHRDAEGMSFAERRDQILEIEIGTRVVPVVPVRMTEAWLFSSEIAIRRAAEHPNGTHQIPILRSADWDRRADIKDCLHECLEIASGLTGRQLDRFRAHRRNRARRRITELTDDFSGLRALDAFNEFERELQEAITF